MPTTPKEFPVRQWEKIADGEASLSVEVHDMYPDKIYLAIAAAEPAENTGHPIKRGSEGLRYVTLAAGESLWAFAPGASPITARLIVTS